jgi:hypothetical protein
LWELAHESERLSCVVYRRPNGLELCIESPTSVIVSERCTLQPRSIARVQALRDRLVQRGWHEAGGGPPA